MTTTEQNIADELMGYDPTDLTVFSQASNNGNADSNLYKPLPRLSVSEDGIYRSKIRLLKNPFSPKDSIMPLSYYWLSSLDGSRMVKSSLSRNDKSCPIFRAWKRHHFSGDAARDEFAHQVFDKREVYYILIQILEDANQPELNGKFRIMKLPKAIFNKLTRILNPSAESKQTPYPALDWVFGLELNLEVTPGPDDPAHPERKQREISYDMSEFGDFAPIIKSDGSELLTETELGLVDDYVSAFRDSQNSKNKSKRESGQKKMQEIRESVRNIAQKVQEYITENLRNEQTGEKLDLGEYGFTPWDDSTRTFVSHWIEMTDNMINPATITYEEFFAKKNKNMQSPESHTVTQSSNAPEDPASGLPF